MFDLRSGNVNGVLLWKIRLNKIWGNVVARSIGKSGTIFITNSGGKVVAHQDPSVIYKNTFYEAITSKDIQPGINGEEVMLVTDKFNMGNRTFLVYGTLPLKEVIYPIYDSEGNIAQVIEYNLDISKRKMAEEKIKASLKEKELLLREIHHRVKNNMQIISSLISLQSEMVGDKKYNEMLRDTRNRIKAMSLIHEKLYRSEDLEHIDFSAYIQDLTGNILRFYETASYQKHSFRGK